MLEVIQYTIGMSNGFFLWNGETVIAVDSGGEMGDGPFLNVCRKHSFDPRKIALLIVTHGHVDHFVNMGSMKTLTGAPLLCHKLAAPFLREGLKPAVFGRNALGRAIMEKQAIEGDPIPFVPKVEPDILFEGTYDLKPWGIDGKIIETPGHSKCSTAIILDTGEALVGDTIAQPPGTSSVVWRSCRTPKMATPFCLTASRKFCLPRILCIRGTAAPSAAARSWPPCWKKK